MAPGGASTTPGGHGGGASLGVTSPHRGLVGQPKRQGNRATPGERGYDAGEKIKGGKRHLLVDTLGRRLVGVLSAASVQDRDGARLLLRRLPRHGKKPRLSWVDSAEAGRSVAWVAGLLRFRLSVVLRPKERRQFLLLPQRWVLERPFSWLHHGRRLSKDYERLMPTSEPWIYLAMIKLIANRLTEAEGFQTASKRCV